MHCDPLGFPVHVVVQAPATQHSPLHGDMSEHDAVQVCDPESQACPKGQSLGPLQPHIFPETHPVPAAFCEQSAQVPLAPHALPSVPAAQIPEAEQHPVAHGFCAEHGAPHRFVFGSHTEPLGQSDVEPQPHCPATQA
jgi:hypothetical protein